MSTGRCFSFTDSADLLQEDSKVQSDLEWLEPMPKTEDIKLSSKGILDNLNHNHYPNMTPIRNRKERRGRKRRRRRKRDGGTEGRQEARRKEEI